MAHGKKRACIIAALGAILAAALLLGLTPRSKAAAAVQPARFIFVGTEDDADCAILLSQGSCAVIDTGEEQDAEHILDLLRGNGVEQIDCLILTHPDKDHIGGAPTLLANVPVKQVFVPDYRQENARYSELKEQMSALGVPVTVLGSAQSLACGDLWIEIYPPQKSEYKGENNYSLITYVKHGDISLLLAGDAKKKRLSELDPGMFGRPDIYKVAYHGRSSGTGAQWITALRPRCAVVTAAEADAEILSALNAAGSRVLYTRPLNDIYFTSSGTALRLES